MSDKSENREEVNLEDRSEDAKTEPSDYHQLKGIATVGLNVALFGNTVADMKNIYDTKDTNGSTDVYVVLWLLRLSFCFQVFVALIAILMYVMGRKDDKCQQKSDKYKRLSIYNCDEDEPEQNHRFHRPVCCGLSLYKMLYLTSLICILIITFLQIIASIWSAGLGIELKSANEEVDQYTSDSHTTMNPNFTTTMETTTPAYHSTTVLTSKGTTTSSYHYQRSCGPNRACEFRRLCGTNERVYVYHYTN
ncbi:uncharacterized protein LOC123550155 [Mercenaria mercenaria]|uniref:uncharacterized protein LOC123550155 n=1 Tax=Mercenaria mercenaria TaxID=6596 RepID=UPI00234E3FC9|nr:uncharacterized protein LOC123550155 [Mercenaria mercenaria]